MGREVLKEKLRGLPTAPGCYLFYDAAGRVIYVGKAKSLKSRVRSYFTPAAALEERTKDLVPRIADLELRQVGSELDALLLEYRLIKQYKPWFNVVMKWNKERPYLKISRGGLYPALSVAAVREEDGAAYYDCFVDEEAVKEALALFCRVWGTARCGRQRFENVASPCLYHTIAGCRAPCAGRAEPAGYAGAVEEIQALLRGSRVAAMAALREQMERHAAELEFEKAADCKLQLDALNWLQRQGRRMYHYPERGEAVVLIRPWRERAYSAFYVRDGAVLGRSDHTGCPGKEEVKALLAGWRKNGAEAPEGRLVAKSLTEIGAEKIFVQLTPRSTGVAVWQQMQRFIK